MLGITTIVFREFLEIALVLTIVMAATRGLNGRGFLLAVGLGIGIVGSAIIAYFTSAISNAIDGLGQEVFNASIMFIAVGFLSWTVIWMKTHGRELAENLKKVGEDVKMGNRPLSVLIFVVALATFREGAEIVLFTHGMLLSGTVTMTDVFIGGAIGALGGTALGIALYFGLLKTAKRHLFTVTGWMLIFLTAGMAAKGTNYLISADVLPAIIPQLWDTSHILSASSLVGEMFGVMIGYTPRPSAMELIVYLFVLASVGLAYQGMGKKPKGGKPIPQSA